MKKVSIVIGANYGDEGKGTVSARLSKDSGDSLNVLTNGGAQRGHTIQTADGAITTFQHFGSGTLYGSSTYCSKFFILNPMIFVTEYNKLLIKPKNVFRDKECRWSTPYDSMANLITEQLKKRHASCGVGIWTTIQRYQQGVCMSFDEFCSMEDWRLFLDKVRNYYEKIVKLEIPSNWKDIWYSNCLQEHFHNDCLFMHKHTKVCDLKDTMYEHYIFENGQGLLLSDKGKDDSDRTPSKTGIEYSLELIRELGDIEDITAHYVSRPYLTRHGAGYLRKETSMKDISKDIRRDSKNFRNNNQGEFRYGLLDIPALKKRIIEDSIGINFVLDVTHCDEMDREKEFRQAFSAVNCIDSAIV